MAKKRTTVTLAPYKATLVTQGDHLCSGHVTKEGLDSASSSKKRRRVQCGQAEGDLELNGATAGFRRQIQREKAIKYRKDSERSGYVDENGLKNTSEKAATSKETETDQDWMSESLIKEGLINEEYVNIPEKKQIENSGSEFNQMLKSEESENSPASVPFQAHASGVGMTCPANEEPIELCPFSSDEDVESTHVESLRQNKSVDSSPRAVKDAISTPKTETVSIPTDTVCSIPAAMTTENVAQFSVNRTIGRRRRRKRLSYSVTRSKSATKAKQEQNNVTAVPALEEKLSVLVGGNAVETGVHVEADADASPSPVYPDANASHLYPSIAEGAPWKWEDLDPFFDPLAQSDLNNLVRWRKENADFIAANPSVWRNMAMLEMKRAVLESIVADALDTSKAHVEFPIRRGRNYLDVWEETDFLCQRKRDTSVRETQVKSQVVSLKKKRKGAFIAEGSLLASNRNLVYGYDDDLFQDFKRRLETQVKACQPNSSPSTPCAPILGCQRLIETNVDEDVAQSLAEKAEFVETVLPSFPIRQLHPASLGLWKLRKNQEPDYLVVHPASIGRSEVTVRWKEEMKRHHQQQYELQLQQTDELGDPSDGDDEGAGGATRNRLRATISNCEVTGELPSFGNCVEEDEISQAISASMRSLISLSIYNWRTAQLVYERAACSIQCAPILGGEDTAARELEDLFLRLYPSSDSSEIVAVLPDNGLTRQPRSQMKSSPQDVVAYSVRHGVADHCSLAVAASVEFALQLSAGDVVDVLDRNGCWNYGEIVETYSEETSGVAKFILVRFSLWSEDTVEWIAASEGRVLPQGVADGSRPCSVGPTCAHRARVRYDQSLAKELELSFPQRQAKQAIAASHMLAQRQRHVVKGNLNDLHKTPPKRKRKRPDKSVVVATATSS